MSVAVNAFAHRDYYPLVGTTDTLVIVFAYHGSDTARPRLTLTAGESDTEVLIRSGPDLNISSFTLSEAVSLPQLGSQLARDLPIDSGDTVDSVTVVTVTRGKVAVNLDSPIPARSFLQQPLINPPLS